MACIPCSQTCVWSDLFFSALAQIPYSYAWIAYLAVMDSRYRKVASRNMSRLVARPRIFRPFMKGKFDPYVLWPLAFDHWPLNSRPVYCSRLYGRSCLPLMICFLWDEKMIFRSKKKHFLGPPKQIIRHTVKSRAVDRSTIQFWNLLVKGHST